MDQNIEFSYNIIFVNFNYKNMKSQTHKNRIVIPQLIKKIKIKSDDKQNICTNGARNDHLADHHNKQISKMKISQYLDKSHDSQKTQNDSKNQQSKLLQQKTNQSTHRTLQVSQQNVTQSIIAENEKRNNIMLNKFQDLLKSDRMVVNPDKWEQFIHRAMSDQNFHKAFNIFLYSYFIQHYN